MAETLTVVRLGGCLITIQNMNDEEFIVSLPVVDPEEYEIESNAIQVDNFVAQGAVTREDRVGELRNRIRTDHSNYLEKRYIMNICEYYNDIFK